MPPSYAGSSLFFKRVLPGKWSSSTPTVLKRRRDQNASISRLSKQKGRSGLSRRGSEACRPTQQRWGEPCLRRRWPQHASVRSSSREIETKAHDSLLSLTQQPLAVHNCKHQSLKCCALLKPPHEGPTVPINSPAGDYRNRGHPACRPKHACTIRRPGSPTIQLKRHSVIFYQDGSVHGVGYRVFILT